MNAAINNVRNKEITTCFVPMQLDFLEEVLLIENDVYPHPWTRGNFLDSLYSGYDCWTLQDETERILGYFLAMRIVDEIHLLNLAVRRDMQGCGMGVLLLDNVAMLAQKNGMDSILLEVRLSNKRALTIYKRYGFCMIGLRKGYYPASCGIREDAVIMRLKL
jgi:[ribosomal protein S18]-alanine N-acetyltransferase